MNIVMSHTGAEAEELDTSYIWDDFVYNIGLCHIFITLTNRFRHYTQSSIAQSSTKL